MPIHKQRIKIIKPKTILYITAAFILGSLFIAALIIKDLLPVFGISLFIILGGAQLISNWLKKIHINILKGAAKLKNWTYQEEMVIKGVNFKALFNKNKVKIYTTIKRDLLHQITFYRKDAERLHNPRKNLRETGYSDFDTIFLTKCEDEKFADLFCSPSIRNFLIYPTGRFTDTLCVTSNNEGLIFYCNYPPAIESNSREIVFCINQHLELARLIVNNPNNLPAPEEYTAPVDNFTTIEEYVDNLKRKKPVNMVENCETFFRHYYGTENFSRHNKSLASSKNPFVRYLASLFLLQGQSFKNHIKHNNVGCVSSFLNILKRWKDQTFIPKLKLIYRNYPQEWIKKQIIQIVVETEDPSIPDFLFHELQRIRKYEKSTRRSVSDFAEIEGTIAAFLGRRGDKKSFYYIRDYTSWDLPDNLKSIYKDAVKNLETSLGLDASKLNGRLSMANMEGPKGGLSKTDEN